MTTEQKVLSDFFEKEIRKGVCVVRLNQDMSFTSQKEVECFWQDLCGLLEYSMIVINFENVEKQSSSVLGKIIKLNRETGERGIQLALCSIKPCIFEVFQITHLKDWFEIYETENDAVRALAS
jgi:anti-sigma B factor antagonist